MARAAPRETFADLIPRRSKPQSLGIQLRLFLMQVLVFGLLTLSLAAIQVYVLRQSIQQEYGQRALAISRTVAQIPTILAAFDSPQPSQAINPLANLIRQQVGADFIVVGNRQGIRLSHPLPDRLGKPMMGGDNDLPLSGQEIVSVATGSLGTSIRGKVPVWKNGQVVGVVSTGYLLPTVQSLAGQVSLTLLPWFGLALLLALVSSVLISGRIKRDILDLEPEQISALLQQHRAVLAALQEGVLLTNQKGEVQMLNPKAVQMLGLSEPISLPIWLADLWPELYSSAALAGYNQENLSLRLGSLPVLVSVYRMTDGRFVITFRDRAEIVELAKELTQTQQYAGLLRAQTHEFMNRLHTIAGLIQLGKPTEALKVIRTQTQQSRALQEMVKNVALPRLAALIIGKYDRARELGVRFSLEAGSSVGQGWHSLSEVLELAVGNLLENAFEALAATNLPTKETVLLIGEDPEGLQIEVRQKGAPIPSELGQRIFERGFSTKGVGRGLGLSLVKQQIEGLGGNVQHFERGDFTVFQVNLPRLPGAPL